MLNTGSSTWDEVAALYHLSRNGQRQRKKVGCTYEYRWIWCKVLVCNLAGTHCSGSMACSLQSVHISWWAVKLFEFTIFDGQRQRMRVGCTYRLTCAYCGSAARCWYGIWPVHTAQVVGLAESSYQLVGRETFWVYHIWWIRVFESGFGCVFVMVSVLW